MGAEASNKALRNTCFVLAGVALVGQLFLPGLHLALLAGLLVLAASQIGQ